MEDPFLKTKYFMSETDPGRIRPSRAEVAFVGRSNAGKSSLINALCHNKKLAVVSKTPGRTRGINVFEVVKGKWLIDLPGYGFANASERSREYWPKMIRLTLSTRPNMARVYVLMDAERGVTPIDRDLLDWLEKSGIPFRMVGTKVDRLGPSHQKDARVKMAHVWGGLEPDHISWVSAREGYGLKELKRDVATALDL